MQIRNWNHKGGSAEVLWRAAVATVGGLVLGVVGSTLLVIGGARTCAAAEPPADSPMARHEHPRLGFTATDLATLRTRIATHYRTEFQAFLNLLADPSKLTSSQKETESYWGGMNLAFVAALDPAEMAARGFTFSANIDSRAELCDGAMAYVRTQLPSIAAAKGQGHSALNTGYPTSIYFPVAATYDWCYASLPDSARREIVDAFVAGFAVKYAGYNPLTMKIGGLSMLANNQASSDIHDALGVAAFYGDAYPDASKQAEMYNTFDAIWVRRVVGELAYLYPQGTGWHEGSGGYMSESVLNLSMPLSLIGPALGRNILAELPFYTELAQFGELIVKPMGYGATCGSSGTTACPTYFERWGTISSGISRLGCKASRFVSGALSRSGHPNTGRIKALWENTFRCDETTVTRYGGSWSHGVMLWFLFGDRELNAVPRSVPGLRRSSSLGLGLVGMKSGFGPDDTQVVMFAPEISTYGHDSPDYGTFTIFKHGNLVLQPANNKSGEGSLSLPAGVVSRGALFQNVLTAHKGTEDHGLWYGGSAPADPVFKDLGRAATTTLLLNGVDFDYVGYDNTPLWGTIATASQRELVYVRGPEASEYVVVLDRVNTTSPATDEKIWRAWVPTKPEFVNGAESSPRLGKWTSTTSDTVSMTNRFGRLLGSDFESGPTHGKFFLRTLWPTSRVINFVGGEGREFQSGNDDGTTPWGTPVMSQAAREYLGWGRIEVRSATSQAYDLFLNVFQFGDADALDSMSPVLRLTSSDGAMAGAHLRDSRNEWVLMFRAGLGGSVRPESLSYVYSPGTATSKHLLANLEPSARVYVSSEDTTGGSKITITTAARAGAAEATVSAAGTLYFQLTGQSVVALPLPGTPRGIRVVR